MDHPPRPKGRGKGNMETLPENKGEKSSPPEETQLNQSRVPRNFDAGRADPANGCASVSSTCETAANSRRISKYVSSMLPRWLFWCNQCCGKSYYITKTGLGLYGSEHDCNTRKRHRPPHETKANVRQGAWAKCHPAIDPFGDHPEFAGQPRRRSEVGAALSE